MPGTAQDRFIAASEAAARLGLSLNTVKRRVDRQILAGYKDPVNGYYYVSERSVRRALELREALQRSALLPGAAKPRKEWVSRPAAASRR